MSNYELSSFEEDISIENGPINWRGIFNAASPINFYNNDPKYESLRNKISIEIVNKICALPSNVINNILDHHIDPIDPIVIKNVVRSCDNKNYNINEEILKKTCIYDFYKCNKVYYNGIFNSKKIYNFFNNLIFRGTIAKNSQFINKLILANVHQEKSVKIVHEDFMWYNRKNLLLMKGCKESKPLGKLLTNEYGNFDSTDIIKKITFYL